MSTDELAQTIEESGKVAELAADGQDLKAAALWMIVKMLGVIALELRGQKESGSNVKKGD